MAERNPVNDRIEGELAAITIELGRLRSKVRVQLRDLQFKLDDVSAKESDARIELKIKTNQLTVMRDVCRFAASDLLAAIPEHQPPNPKLLTVINRLREFGR